MCKLYSAQALKPAHERRHEYIAPLRRQPGDVQALEARHAGVRRERKGTQAARTSEGEGASSVEYRCGFCVEPFAHERGQLQRRCAERVGGLEVHGLVAVGML